MKQKSIEPLNLAVADELLAVLYIENTENN